MGSEMCIRDSVTIYSGYDYLRKNWDIIKDGAVKEK